MSRLTFPFRSHTWILLIDRWAPTAFRRGKDDSCASLRVGTGFVVIQWYPQMPANVGELGRADIKNGTGYLYGADKRLRGSA